MQWHGNTAHLSGQKHIQQVTRGGEAAAQGVPWLAVAHVHFVALLLHLVPPQVDQAQHNDAAFGPTQAQVAPVCGVHFDGGQGMVQAKVLAPEHRASLHVPDQEHAAGQHDGQDAGVAHDPGQAPDCPALAWFGPPGNWPW